MEINLSYIPYRRYVLMLKIDKNKEIYLGRFCRKKSVKREQNRLSDYKGYKPRVIDTKLMR